MRTLRILLGIVLIVIAAGLSGMAVMAGVGMAGMQAGLVIFCGLGGLGLICS